MQLAYRPVSLISVVCKVNERIVKDINEFNVTKSNQRGFTSGHSCLTNLLEFVEEGL